MGFLNVVDIVSQYEKLVSGLCGGEVSKYFKLEATSECAQTKALRCTKAKALWRGCFCFCVEKISLKI
jgi:hypothetical protein